METVSFIRTDATSSHRHRTIRIFDGELKKEYKIYENRNEREKKISNIHPAWYCCCHLHSSNAGGTLELHLWSVVCDIENCSLVGHRTDVEWIRLYPDTVMLWIVSSENLMRIVEKRAVVVAAVLDVSGYSPFGMIWSIYLNDWHSLGVVMGLTSVVAQVEDSSDYDD